MRKYDDAQPRADDGKWTAGGGGGGERAAASLQDSSFVNEHMTRLSAAGDEARTAFAREEHGGDAAHGAAQAAIHAEAGRIHAERDAAAGSDQARLQQVGDDSHRWTSGSTAEKHDAALAAIAREKETLSAARADTANVDQAVAEGHVTNDIPHAAEDHFQAEHERIVSEVTTQRDSLDAAHLVAADAIGKLDSLGLSSDDGEHDWSGKVDKATSLHEAFDETSQSFAEQTGGAEHESFDRSDHSSGSERTPDGGFAFDHEGGFPNAPEERDHQADRADLKDLKDRQAEHDASKPDPIEHDPEATPAENAAAHEEHQQALVDWHDENESIKSDQADLNSSIAEHAAAQATYEHALAQHEAEFKSRADAAQHALEALHEHQIAAAQKLPGLEKQHDEAKAAAQSEVDNLNADHLVNHAAVAHDGEASARAAAASESLLNAESYRRSEGHSIDLEGARESLKSEMRSTASAIKQLSKVTGRTPRIPAKTKKFANRPDDALQASVVGMAALHRLKIESLKFISLVDNPAQATARVLLVKRAGVADELKTTATLRIMKVAEGDNPLIYCWAFTCTDDAGQPYHDLQGDAISPDFIKAAEEFLASGAASDEMHDENTTGRIAFGFPMDGDIAKAFFGDVVGKQIKASGLMVAVRASKDAVAKVRSGEYTGVSIAGTGTREPIGKTATKPACKGCGGYMAADDKSCKGCGAAKATKALATSERDVLPDNAFLYVEPGGKLVDGKTEPKSLRMFPYRSSAGDVDVTNLRAAVQDIPKSSLADALKTKLQAKAEKLLGKQHSKRVSKQAVLTSEVDGHQHTIDLDDPADGWNDSLSTSYQTATGETAGHSHAWTYDATTGAITIAMDSGHDHTVDAVVPADVIAEAAEDHSKCGSCGAECDDDDRFCPSCGMRMGGNRVPGAVTDDPSSGATVIAISLQAPAGKSPLPGVTPTVKQEPKEHTPMATEKEQIAELEKRAARFEKMSSLTDAARLHLGKLHGSEADAFIAKSAHERETVLADIAKADEVVHTSLSGRVFRKSDSVDLINMAKQLDELTVSKQKADAEVKSATFAKRGDEVLSNFAKGAKGDLRGRIMEALNDKFTVPAEYEEAVTAMKGMNAAFGQLGIPRGYDGSGDSPGASGAQKKLDVAVAAFAKAHSLPIEVAYARATASDPEIRALYNEAQTAGN